jgi:hypothetical protein
MTTDAQAIRSIAIPDRDDPNAACLLADAAVRRWLVARFERVAEHSARYRATVAALTALQPITDAATIADAAQVVADALSEAAADPDQPRSASAATAARDVLAAFDDESWHTIGQRAAVVLYESSGTLSTGPGYLVREAQLVLS